MTDKEIIEKLIKETTELKAKILETEIQDYKKLCSLC